MYKDAHYSVLVELSGGAQIHVASSGQFYNVSIGQAPAQELGNLFTVEECIEAATLFTTIAGRMIRENNLS